MFFYFPLLPVFMAVASYLMDRNESSMDFVTTLCEKVYFPNSQDFKVLVVYSHSNPKSH